MENGHERDSVFPQVRIPAIDRMYDERPRLRADEIKAAHGNALPRAEVLCHHKTDNQDGVIAYSDSLPYRMVGTTQVNIRVGIVRPVRTIRVEHGGQDRVGLLLDFDDPQHNPRPMHILLELSDMFLATQPNTSLDRGLRYDDPSDLESLSVALNLFDGQGDLPRSV